MGAAAVLDGVPGVEEHGNAALLIIDPQVDFHDGADYPGSLAIVGATADSKRIADLILRHPMSFDHIFVSLDTHHRVHIGHGAFWQGTDSSEPPPFTNISHADVVAGKWRAREPQLQQWALDYTKSLEEGGRFVHTVWPYHCVLGTRGHCVTDALMPALDEWSKVRGRAVTWVLKGQNNRTEMYSTFKAEVPVQDDPGTLLNVSLIKSLEKHRQVVVCGQAKSHCVNYSTRDLLSRWPTGRTKDVVLLTDCTTAVGGCEAAADEFEADMRVAGVTLVKSVDFTPAGAEVAA